MNSPSTVDLAVRIAVSDLLDEYVHCIDADELERWPSFFTETGSYRITSAFNHHRGLPIAIVNAENRNMMMDRVAAIRGANVFEPQSYRHILSTVRVIAVDGGTVEAQASFMVVRTLHTGEQHMFVSGYYRDRMIKEEGGYRFSEKLVVLDSDKIDTLLAIPL